MEQDAQAERQRDMLRRDKYKIGQKGSGSAAYNPLNHVYEQSERGQMLK